MTKKQMNFQYFIMNNSLWHEANVLLKRRQNSSRTMYGFKKVFRLRRAFVHGPCPRKKEYKSAPMLRKVAPPHFHMDGYATDTDDTRYGHVVPVFRWIVVHFSTPGNTVLCYISAYAYKHSLIFYLTDNETLNCLPQKNSFSVKKQTLETTYRKVDFQNFPGVKPPDPLQKGWGGNP